MANQDFSQSDRAKAKNVPQGPDSDAASAVALNAPEPANPLAGFFHSQ